MDLIFCTNGCYDIDLLDDTFYKNDRMGMYHYTSNKEECSGDLIFYCFGCKSKTYEYDPPCSCKPYNDQLLITIEENI